MSSIFRDIKRKYQRADDYMDKKQDQASVFAFKKANQISDYVQDTSQALIFGRHGLPPSVVRLLEQKGNEIIQSIQIYRNPVPRAIQEFINVLSGNKVPYDVLFHLGLNIICESGYRFLIEKNEVINIESGRTGRIDGGEQMDISASYIRPNLTLNELLANTKQHMGDDKFIGYSVINNCQAFILAVLNSNQINEPIYNNFVKQDTNSIFKGNDTLRKFSNTMTQIASKANILMEGGKIRHATGVRIVRFKRIYK